MASDASDDRSEERLEGANLLVAIVLRGLWRYRLLVVVAVVVGAAIGTFRGLVIPNQYRSLGKLFIRPGVRDSFAPDTVISGGGGTARIAGVREAVQNEMQVLSVPQLYDKVVERVGADVVLAPYDPAGDREFEVPWHTAMFHSFQSWWFAASNQMPQTDIAVDRAELASLSLEGSLAIIPESNANVISVVYVSHSPERAQVIVNAALEAAKELHTEVFENMLDVRAMEKEAKLFDESAHAADEALRRFRAEHKIYDFEAQQEALQDALVAADVELQAIEVTVSSRDAERTALKTQRDATEPRRVRVGSETWMVNPAYTRLMTTLGFLEQQRITYLLQGGDIGAQAARTVGERIKEVEGELSQTPEQILTRGIEEENPDHLRIVQRLHEVDVDLAVTAARKAKLVEQRTTTVVELQRLEALSPNLRALENDARQKRATADRFADNITNLRTVQRLEQVDLSNVSVLQYGTLEASKIAPQRGKMVVFGAFGGGAIGCALVLLLTLLDRRVRIREDLARLGVPAGGVLVSDARAPARRTDWVLPHSLAGIRHDIAKFWATLPYDRRSTDGLRIAFLPSGDGAEVGRAAAALAVGLAAHGGERVVHVASTEGPTWLAQRLGLTVRRGWHEVLRGEVTLEQAAVETPIPGLTYLPAGAIGNAVPHPMAGPAFVALLDKLAAANRFVIVELPDLEVRPEGRSVLGVVDAAMLVVRRELGGKTAVRETAAAVKTAGARLLGAVLQGPERQPPTA